MDDLDAMLSLWFNTAPDGRKVYFPWRSTGRGYTIASEHDYRRVHQQLKVIWVSVPILGCLLVLLASAAFSSDSALLKGYVILALPIVLVFFPLLFYVWLGYWRYWLRRLQPSDEKYKYERMSRQEVMNFFVARLYPSGALWLMEIVALAFVSLGIVAFIVNPGSRPLGPIVLSGFAAAFFASCWFCDGAPGENVILG